MVTVSVCNSLLPARLTLILGVELFTIVRLWAAHMHVNGTVLVMAALSPGLVNRNRSLPSFLFVVRVCAFRVGTQSCLDVDSKPR